MSYQELAVGNCLSYFPSDFDSVSLIYLVFSCSYFLSFWERKKKKLFYLVPRNTTCYSFFSKCLKLSRKQNNTHPHVTHSVQPDVSPPGSETAPSSSPAICALLLTIWSGCGKVGRAWLLWSTQDLSEEPGLQSCQANVLLKCAGALQGSPYCHCFLFRFCCVDLSVRYLSQSLALSHNQGLRLVSLMPKGSQLLAHICQQNTSQACLFV